MNAHPSNHVSLFYCYAHEDEPYRLELEKHLASFQRQGYLVEWSDRHIQPGVNWRQEIQAHLTSANIIVLLISPDFLYSDSCDAEMRQALSLRQEGRARLIPILLRSVVWQHTPLADLQLLPNEGKPIKRWEDRDEAWQQIATSIGRVVSEMLGIPLLVPAKPVSTSQWEQKAPLFPFDPRNPYKGLAPFRLKDAQDFFGREHLVKALLTKMQSILASPFPEQARLLTVFGASGSGKSSTVLAGLLPALRQGEIPGSQTWIYLDSMVPGSYPVAALAASLSPHFAQRSQVSLQDDLHAASRRGLHFLVKALLKEEAPLAVLYIDQFEELFTQTLEETERQLFLDLLLSAITEPHGHLFVILSLRADFYDRPMRYPAWFRLMEESRIAVLPPDYRDLRDMIKKPAALPDVQLQFEDDLIGELLADTRHQIGVLPLIQFTMDRLFQKRQGHLLTLAAYREMGGLQGALIQHAEATYARLSNDSSRDLARALFLQLVELGASDQDPTRRRVVLSEFVFRKPGEQAIFEQIVSLFTSARLLTATAQQGPQTIEVSHEALIRNWPRLAEWLREAYDQLYIQRRVREDAALWHRLGKPDARLYRAEQLAEALAWQQHALVRQEDISFLITSQQEQERQLQQSIAQRQRIRRRTVLIGIGLTSLALVGTIEGLVLFQERAYPFTLPYIYRGHVGGVYAVAWSPDGRSLASGSEDETVQIWDASSGQRLRLYHATDWVDSVCWSPDGRSLAAASTDVQIWDAINGTLLFTYHGHTDNVNSVCWSPDGRFLASASYDSTIQIWNAINGKTQLIARNHFVNARCVAWSPDGRFLAAAGRAVQIYDAAGKQVQEALYQINTSQGISSVAWSPDGKRLAFDKGDGTIEIRDFPNRKTILTYQGHAELVESVAWSPNGRYVASADLDKTVQIWGALSGQSLLIYRGHAEMVRSVCWSPSGQQLASASTDGTVQLWEIASGQTQLTYLGHTSGSDFYVTLATSIHSVAWSPNGQQLASASVDKTVQIWSAFTGQTQLIYRGHTDFVRCAVWSPDGHLMASASDDSLIQIWDAASGKTLSVHLYIATSLAWSPNGRFLAAANVAEKTVQIWDISNRQTQLTYRGHTDGVTSIAWSPDGHTLASSSADKTVKVWEATSGATLLSYHGHTEAINTVVWAPDGHTLASGSDDKTVQIWDATSGHTSLTYREHTNGVRHIAWSPNGYNLASASDETVRVWDASNGQTLLVYQGHTNVVDSIAWSPFGDRLASASDDRTVQVWGWFSNH